MKLFIQTADELVFHIRYGTSVLLDVGHRGCADIWHPTDSPELVKIAPNGRLFIPVHTVTAEMFLNLIFNLRRMSSLFGDDNIYVALSEPVGGQMVVGAGVVRVRQTEQGDGFYAGPLGEPFGFDDEDDEDDEEDNDEAFSEMRAALDEIGKNLKRLDKDNESGGVCWCDGDLGDDACWCDGDLGDDEGFDPRDRDNYEPEGDKDGDGET